MRELRPPVIIIASVVVLQEKHYSQYAGVALRIDDKEIDVLSYFKLGAHHPRR